MYYITVYKLSICLLQTITYSHLIILIHHCITMHHIPFLPIVFIANQNINLANNAGYFKHIMSAFLIDLQAGTPSVSYSVLAGPSRRYNPRLPMQPWFLRISNIHVGAEATNVQFACPHQSYFYYDREIK